MIYLESIRPTYPFLLQSYERPRIWAPIFEPFSQENHMLTPKVCFSLRNVGIWTSFNLIVSMQMSVRRKNVLNTHMSVIEDMYAGNVGTNLHHASTHSD